MCAFVRCVESDPDFGHSERRPTPDELTAWFAENYDGDIEYHAEYIGEQLELLSRDPGSVTNSHRAG